MNNACYIIDIAILKADKHWFTQFTFGPWQKCYSLFIDHETLDAKFMT